MPTKESRRVDEHRRKNFDQIPVLVEKGGRALLRALAIRENVSVAELIRRAILARAGLKVWPYNMERLSGIENSLEAKGAVLQLQREEQTDDQMKVVIEQMSSEPNNAKYHMVVNMAELKAVIARINSSLEHYPNSDAVMITLTGKEVGTLRRMLSNMILPIRALPGSRERT